MTIVPRPMPVSCALAHALWTCALFSCAAVQGPCPPDMKRVVADRVHQAGEVYVCQDATDPRRHWIETRWRNDALHSRGELINGRESGEWIWGYMNGRVKERGSFRGGLRIGSWVSFHPDGGINVERRYVDGKLDGAFRLRDRGGTLMEQGTFRADAREGEWIRWFPSDKGAVVTTYRAGEEVSTRKLSPAEAMAARVERD